MKKVVIYTDGACSGNPGAGGWGTILVSGKVTKELSGFEANTTNNRMELMAVIKGLEALKTDNVEVVVYSDSKYVVDAFNQNWIKNWVNKINDKGETVMIKLSDKKPVANPDLWTRLIALVEKYKVAFIWVKGHSSNELNNRCDELATGEIKKNKSF